MVTFIYKIQRVCLTFVDVAKIINESILSKCEISSHIYIDDIAFISKSLWNVQCKI